MTDFFGRKNASKTATHQALQSRRNSRLYGISSTCYDRLPVTKAQCDPSSFSNYFLSVFDRLFPLFTGGKKKTCSQLHNKWRELHDEVHRLNGDYMTFKNVQL